MNEIMSKVPHLRAAMTTIVTLLTGFVAWATLDFPRPATSQDIRAIRADMEQLAGDLLEISRYGFETRRMALNQDWWRLEAQLDDIRDRLEAKPRDLSLQMMRRNLARDQQAVQRQMKSLDTLIDSE